MARAFVYAISIVIVAGIHIALAGHAAPMSA